MRMHPGTKVPEHFARCLSGLGLRHEADPAQCLQHALAVELAFGDVALGGGRATDEDAEPGLRRAPIEGLLAARVRRFQFANGFVIQLQYRQCGAPQ